MDNKRQEEVPFPPVGIDTNPLPTWEPTPMVDINPSTDINPPIDINKL